MNYPFSLLAERLGFSEEKSESRLNSGVFAAERWSGSATYREDTVYIFTKEELEEIPLEKHPAMVLVSGSAESVHRKGNTKDSNCRWDDPERLLTAAQAEIRDFYIWNERVSEMLRQERELSDILMAFHDYIRNPCWIIDENLCLLGYTSEDQPEEQAWKDTVKSGYISITGSSIAEFSRTYMLMRESTGYMKYKISALPYRSHSFPIRINDKNVAFLIVIDLHEQITRGKIDLCRQVVIFLTIELRKRVLLQERQDLGNDQFLLDLLNSRIPNDYIAEERLQKIFWEPRKYYAMLAIPGRALGISPEALTRIAQQLITILPRSITLLYEGNIASLLTFPRKESILSKDVYARLAAFLTTYRIRCGISEAYDSLCMTAKEFSYALHTADHIWCDAPADGILFYNDFIFSRVRDMLSEKTDLRSLCYPGLLNLMEYDRAKGTEFTRTLSFYLRNNMSPNKTAEELFIHRSTLNYRLRKIEEIGELDFRNSDLVFLVNLSLRLLLFDVGFASGKDSLSETEPNI